MCVYGAGAIGGLFAARLARAGCAVSMVARGERLAAIRRQGLRLRSARDEYVVRVTAAPEPEELGRQDYVIIAVKAPALADVAARLAPLLDRHTAIVPAMNGVPWWFFEGFGGALTGTRLQAVDPDGVIARAIALERVIGCVVFPAATAPEPGVVQHSSGNRIAIGEPSGVATARVEEFAACLQRAGFEAVVAADIRREVWLKLWGNINFNPLSLLTGQTTDRILDTPQVHELCVQVMSEAARVGEALGISAGMTPQERIAISRKLGKVKSSMLQDAEAGRALEIDAIVGAFVEIAAKLDVPTPFTNALYGLTQLRGESLGLYRIRR